ncbi:MAG: NADH-quinone oxidoreductase subunit NuoF [Anaerolineales bacterium]|nr:NADH-quinone oxidoreductase subunit NuoF [Anaerolineales bacterium]
MKFYRSHVLVSIDPECVAQGAYDVIDRLRKELAEKELSNEVEVLEVPRIAGGADGPDMLIYPDEIRYAGLSAADIPYLVEEHFLKGRLATRFLAPLAGLADEELGPPKPKEVRVVLRNCGKIDPENIEEYIAEDGYLALGRVLEGMTPEEVIEEVLASGLRGRGGAGFPTGLKWRFARNSQDDTKYIICNADEGDPGAFMNRRVLESDPHSVIEGMIVAAYAIGAGKGYVYCRAEYPIAVRTLQIAINQARQFGLLGDNILGSDFSFDLEVRMGAGAFVCGEETALMASIEGQRGMPRPRPPFPAVKGLWGKPTNINNVETYANIPQIILRGADWFASMGTEKSKGTKTFALAGDVKNSGLIEVPFGITLREIVYEVAGGIKGDKKYKAVQTGGPMGGCLPAELLDLPVDYESLASAGSIMGSGGMIVMDEDTCMVDIARFFMEFTQDESCGKCTPCRVGTKRILEILERICAGDGREGDIEQLEELCEQIRKASLCGLGQGAPNPVISTLKHFRHEYEAHIYEKRCPSGTCQQLTRASCVHACPAGVDSPAYLALVAQGRFAEGLAVHRDANPFALICGRVCPAFCESNCRRGLLDEPVSIRQVKRFMADQFYNTPWTPEKIGMDKNKSVAVIGAGPGGLTAALRLAQNGYSVTVFEKLPNPGGMMTYGIPEYRLPREPLFSEIDNICRAGVAIRCGEELGKDFTLQSLLDDSYSAVVLALGAHKSQRMGIPGENMGGVYPGVEFLRNIALKNPVNVKNKQVFVIGGGDVAIDSARSAWRMGAKAVHVVYRREEKDMPAHREEIEAAQAEGIQFHFLVNPVEILGNGCVNTIRLQKQTLGDFDNSGRRRPQPLAGSEYEMACDLVIPAIGQYTGFDWMLNEGIETDRGRKINVGKAFETLIPGVFAAGDCVSGPATVIQAVAQGNKVAMAVDKWLTDGTIETVVYHPKRHDIAQYFDVQEFANARRPIVPELSVEQRAGGFAEVELGLEEWSARNEAKRCLRCDLEWLELVGNPVPEATPCEGCSPSNGNTKPD